MKTNTFSEKSNTFPTLFPIEVDTNLHLNPGKVPVPDWLHTWKQMQRKGVTLKLLWLRYKSEHSDGYQYSQYCDNYGKWCGIRKLSMHLTSKAGEFTEVDYAGSTLPLTDKITGTVSQVPVFVS